MTDVLLALILLTQGHLKKRKLESGESQPTKDVVMGEGGGNGRKSVEDEVQEESKSVTSSILFTPTDHTAPMHSFA